MTTFIATAVFQQTFDRIVKHLLQQGRQSINDFGSCRYRGENGASCAVGCLITDEAYYPSMEGAEARHLSVLNAVEESLNMPSGRLTKTDRFSEFLREAQIIHDNYDMYKRDEVWEDYIRDRFRLLAKKYNLETYALDKPQTTEV